MKKALVLSTLALLISGNVCAKAWLLTSAESGVEQGNWQVTSQQLKIKHQTFSIEQKVLHGGKQEDHHHQQPEWPDNHPEPDSRHEFAPC